MKEPRQVDNKMLFPSINQYNVKHATEISLNCSKTLQTLFLPEQGWLLEPNSLIL